MAASTFGTIGFYGLASEQAKGLYAASMSVNIGVDEVEVPNHQGETIAYIQLNQKADISLSGVTTNAATTSQAIAAVLDTANTAMYGTDTSVTVFIVNGINLTRTAKGVEEGEVMAKGWTTMTDNSAA